MNTAIERKIGSTIYKRIHEVPMSEAERQRALEALYEAHMLVDSFLWVGKKIEQAWGRLFLKPALKG